MQLNKLSPALALAIEAHQGQIRKSTTIPYISHPMAVASIALEFGASENQAIAALLHDAIEDGGNKYANIIKPNLANMFTIWSKAVPMAHPTTPAKKPLG